MPPRISYSITVRATASSISPDIPASNDSEAAQAGVLPNAPGAVTVGATASDVPPVMTPRAAVWCTSQCFRWHGYWSTCCWSHKPF